MLLAFILISSHEPLFYKFQDTITRLTFIALLIITIHLRILELSIVARLVF